MLVRVRDFCMTQREYNEIVAEVRKTMRYYRLIGSDSLLNLYKMGNYCYISLDGGRPVGFLTATVVNNEIHAVEVYRFCESVTFSKDVFKFYHILANTNPEYLVFTVQNSNFYADSIALKYMDKYFSYMEQYHVQDDSVFTKYYYRRRR